MIVFDQQRCIAWASLRLGRPLHHAGWWTAIGHEVDGELVAAVFYTQGDSEEDISMHVVARPGAAWLTSDFAAAAFRYPFNQLQLRRVSAAASVEDQPFQRMLKALGFTWEGIKRRFIGGRDFALFGMLREECRYVR